MEECGRGAAVEQLTARGMVSIPAMGAIVASNWVERTGEVSIPAMGGNSLEFKPFAMWEDINPRDGGQ